MEFLNKTFLYKRIAALSILLQILSVSLYANQYDLNESTIDGGGGTSYGGNFIVVGTAGQHDAGYSSGGNYALFGGFWQKIPSCTIDFIHFARFAEHWMDTPCNQSNRWCNGADLNHENDVDFIDLNIFVEQWLKYCPMGWPLK
jgi:hypothetical protein